MDNKHLKLNANLIVAALQKPASELTKADIIDYIVNNDIRMVNFMYPGGDGKLKTLNFVINDLDYLETILTCGERVDGSSLFSFIQAGSSDLYVLPRFRTAFVDPFAEIPTVSLLCSYFDKDGNPLESSPEYTLHKAAEAFREVTGMEYQAMGELEYYVISDDEEVFPAQDQRGYHESAPYAKANEFRTQCMQYIAQAGGLLRTSAAIMSQRLTPRPTSSVRSVCSTSHRLAVRLNMVTQKWATSLSTARTTNRTRLNFCPYP